MSTLQRRRVNRADSGTRENSDQLDAGNEPSRTESKVAYDPDDINSEKKYNAPKLSLMEEVLLMGLRDREGYLSFWNDSISYALRGCIIMELALRGKIRVLDDPSRKRFDISERLVELIDGSKTGEVLLDETIELMKNDQPLTIANWIDLLSGESWNLLKVNYQLKQVRERLAKGLVDKGVLGTEMKNFFLFDMPTHPLVDTGCKEAIRRRILAIVSQRSMDLQYNSYFPSNTQFKLLRSICLVVSTYGANVLDNVLSSIDYDKKDKAITRTEEIIEKFSQFPFDLTETGASGMSINLFKEAQEELASNPGYDLQLEVIAGVIEVFSRMDMIL